MNKHIYNLFVSLVFAFVFFHLYAVTNASLPFAILFFVSGALMGVSIKNIILKL
jgi:hypothetical protein